MWKAEWCFASQGRLGDDLKKEVQKKFKARYPQSNILFQTPERTILYRDKTEIGEYDLSKPEAILICLQDFFGGRAETEIQWEQAIQDFKGHIHDFGNQLLIATHNMGLCSGRPDDAHGKR